MTEKTIFTSRMYSGMEDLQQMLNLLHKARPPQYITDYPSIQDLQELLSQPAIQANTRLWLDNQGRVAAFALVDAYNNILFEFDRISPGSEVVDEMISWGIECIQRELRRTGQAVTLDAGCREEEAEKIAILERHGFLIQPTRSLQLARPLKEPLQEPRVPAGFNIRPTKGLSEVEDWVQLHRLAFGTDHMTHEERAAMMSGADYDPQLDLVAVAPDGKLAAYCVCWINRDENRRSGRSEGWTDPVATHPDYQRRGLAKALLWTGLRLLRDREIETAVMGTSSENVAMRRAAESVGFRVVSSRIWFSKPIQSGKFTLQQSS